METLTDRWNEDAEEIHNLLSFVHDEVKDNSDVHFYMTKEDGILFTGTETLSRVCQVFLTYEQLELMHKDQLFRFEGVFVCKSCEWARSEFLRSAENKDCCTKCMPDE